MVKNPPANAGDTQDTGWIPWRTYSSILAWRIPWIEEPGGSPQGCKELDMTKVTYHTHTRPTPTTFNITSGYPDVFLWFFSLTTGGLLWYEEC